jgi:hypothetical protein
MTTMPDDIAIPAYLEAAGADLYRSAVADYDLSVPELAALLQAAETLDTLRELEDSVRANGRVLPSGKPNPLLLEARQQRAILVRLLGLLDLRIDDAGQPSDSTGAPAMSPTSRAARAAARKRWDRTLGR